MKIFSFLLLAMMLSVPALAAQADGTVPDPAAAPGYQGPSASYGGFQGPTGGTDNNTVAKALKAWDESPVVLTGNIVFWGKTVTPANTVRIAGEVDKEMFEATKIDVKFLEILK